MCVPVCVHEYDQQTNKHEDEDDEDEEKWGHDGITTKTIWEKDANGGDGGGEGCGVLLLLWIVATSGGRGEAENVVRHECS